MKLDAVINAVIKFAEAEILPALDTTHKWVAAFGLGMLRSQSSTLAERIKQMPYIDVLGIIDQDGEINVDAVLAVAENTVKMAGKFEFELPYLGKFLLDEPGFNSLGKYIKSEESN